MRFLSRVCYICAMKWILVGLGNPDIEYDGTRHNVGRDILRAVAKKIPAKATLVELDVYMNNSGGPIKKLIASKAAAEGLIVVHDDLDIALGRVKMSFGSGAGGHRGVDSIQKALKTKDFVRLRVGISPATPTGKLKKPDQEKVVDFVLGKFRKPELEKLKKSQKIVLEAIELLVEDGRPRAMTETNAK
ncbi:MAG: Aminoacyl-tRNA hydrolase, peptidyl-tRNA hydrolase, family [Candidatus Adlerbacteria bacterium]|nr:Aminoacyl-tRNA hydrolase, peptidyl-tRNA hydrolase, family [Candidatus Adlerbacteria bacterium]